MASHSQLLINDGVCLLSNFKANLPREFPERLHKASPTGTLYGTNTLD